MPDIGADDAPTHDAEDDMDVPRHREIDEDTTKEQNANESTPAAVSVGRKRQRVFGSPKVVKKKVNKSAKAVRIESAEKLKAKKDLKKSEETIKKGFKSNFLTVKFKLSALQVKAGRVPDFALFVKDDVHDPTVTNSAKHAGMYLSYFKGDIGDKFFSKQGISYNPKDFYVCENEIDFREDRIGPFLKTKKDTTKKVEKNPQFEVSSSFLLGVLKSS